MFPPKRRELIRATPPNILASYELNKEITLEDYHAVGDPGIMNEANNGPWRKLLRFSLRSLLVLVVVIACWLGWIVHSARVQRDAIAAIKKLGGTALYDWERKDGRSLPSGKPRWPKWLVDRIGIDYFGHVTQVRLVATPELSDVEFDHISRLSGLEELDLHRSPVTDDQLACVERLPELQSLVLFNTEVSDAGMARLKRLVHLGKLSIENTKVTDAGVQSLQRALPTLMISR
jgi:hypothetical protein